MAEYATKTDLQALRNDVRDDIRGDIREAVEDLSSIISILAQSMHNELAEVKAEQAKMKESINRLTNTIDGFVARIDRYETEQTARDSQFEKLLIWARKVSEKTGIPLDNL